MTYPAPFSRDLPAPLRSLAEHRSVLIQLLGADDDLDDVAVCVPRAWVESDELELAELRRAVVKRAARKLMLEGRHD